MTPILKTSLRLLLLNVVRYTFPNKAVYKSIVHYKIEVFIYLYIKDNIDIFLILIKQLLTILKFLQKEYI